MDMNDLTRTWIQRVAGSLMIVAGLVALISAQSMSVADLRSQLRSRYDIVALQRGVALVPRDQGSKVRMIQIVDGIVSVDGETLTGRELNERLGRDAALVVQASYLDTAGRRELTAGAAPANAPAMPAMPAMPPMPAAPVPPAEPAPAPAPAETPERTPRANVRYGDVVRVASGGVTIGKDERVEGEVVAILGGATIDGEVTRDVTVIAGPLRLGPDAVVRGNVVVVGGRMERDPGATIMGSVEEVGIGHRGLLGGGPFFSRGWPMLGVPFLFGDRPAHLFAAAGTLVRILLTILLALIVIAVARPAIERVGELAAAAPARAGITGLLAELLFLPAVIAVTIVLAISIVGIPLLLLMPFVFGAFLVVMLVGFTAAAYVVGTRVTQRLNRPDMGPFGAVAFGVVALAGLTLLAKLVWVAIGGFIGLPLVALGYFIEYSAWTVGFGAVLLTWMERRRTLRGNIAPPPAPTAVSA
jgi:hypothetical protein